MITIKKIDNKKDLATAQQIRHEVFVVGQNVPVEDEVDAFENSCSHYLAFFNNKPVGAARWRVTENGIKLERFSVIREFRGRGAGAALVEKVLKDVRNSEEGKGKSIYLHAQVEVVPFYRRYGVRKVGDMFDESGILHYKMVLEE